MFYRWLQSTEKKSLMVKHLHKVLYIINLGLNEDFESHRPDFSQALEDNGIFNLLSKVLFCFLFKKEKNAIGSPFLCPFLSKSRVGTAPSTYGPD